MNNNLIFRLDGISLIIYLALVCIGLINIYSTGYSEELIVLWNLENPIGKQFWFFVVSLCLLPLVLFIKPNFFDHLSYLILFISLPIVLIILQPDAGSALVFLGLFFVLLREGLDLRIFYLGLGMISIFIFTLLFDPLWVSICCLALILISYGIIKNNQQRTSKTPFITLMGLCVLFSYSVNFIFNSIFEQRHRDRFNIILGLETDTRGIGYNINQSKIAIGSGGFSGKGFLNGTQTKGGFVPQQHTDYIFTTISEEWGFLGSSSVVLLFTALICRVLIRAERHSTTFPRAYSYGFASMLFVHFFVNIGMTLGLVPTVGIPLPFVSYGGSSLLAFSLMLFIYLNFDANRLS
ncbi:MAG: rod shape-determining protein RodA [Flavobacteriia bacterium]|nr:rod shape-determining protein RodA [Flavobacteriia bacterium]